MVQLTKVLYNSAYVSSTIYQPTYKSFIADLSLRRNYFILILDTLEY